jgi:quercetin dioxygenase-like cupin family protein
MNRHAFENMLANEGFETLVTVEREANGALGDHAHPFEAKALILQGELLIQVGDLPQRYQTGDVFHLMANVMHSEQYGPQGVTYLVGRK